MFVFTIDHKVLKIYSVAEDLPITFFFYALYTHEELIIALLKN